VGSLESLDVINEDTNRDEKARATGYMGKSSAVTWVQRAKKAATNDAEDEKHVRRSTGTAANGPFVDSTYQAEPLLSQSVETDEVNPLEWPLPHVASALVGSFFQNIHDSFPVLCKQDLMEKFRSFPKDQYSAEDHCWLSLVNMVFAIGARFAHLTHAEYRGHDKDHCMYYARARALGMDERTLNKDPELQHLTCLGILGLYLLTTDQLNR
jgi:hypothetical protein